MTLVWKSSPYVFGVHLKPGKPAQKNEPSSGRLEKACPTSALTQTFVWPQVGSYKATSSNKGAHVHSHWMQILAPPPQCGREGCSKKHRLLLRAFCPSLFLMSLNSVCTSHPKVLFRCVFWLSCRRKTFARLCNREFSKTCNYKPKMHETVNRGPWYGQRLLSLKFNSIHEKKKRKEDKRLAFWQHLPLQKTAGAARILGALICFPHCFCDGRGIKSYCCNWTNVPRLLPDNWWFSWSHFFDTPCPRCPLSIQIALWPLSTN